MKPWKKLKPWQKGGAIGIIFGIFGLIMVFLIIKLGEYMVFRVFPEGSSAINLLNIFFTYIRPPITFLFVPFFFYFNPYIDSYPSWLLIISVIAYDLILWSMIGALIGWIISKIKAKKLNS